MPYSLRDATVLSHLGTSLPGHHLLRLRTTRKQKPQTHLFDTSLPFWLPQLNSNLQMPKWDAGMYKAQVGITSDAQCTEQAWGG